MINSLKTILQTEIKNRNLSATVEDITLWAQQHPTHGKSVTGLEGVVLYATLLTLLDAYAKDHQDSPKSVHEAIALTITSDNRSLVGYTGKDREELVIPEYVEDNGTLYRVTSIGDKAFYGCNNLVAVTLPSSVTSIGAEAFYRCKNLASINIPNSVTYIGIKAFRFCESLTSITIPDSITKILEETFSDCIRLTSVTLPASVTFIGEGAFAWCERLLSINIPSYVTSIGAYAFIGCTALISANITASVTSIGTRAFSLCTSLTDINFTGSEEQWNAITFGEVWNYNCTVLNINYNCSNA